MGRGPLVGRGFRDKEIFNTLDGLIKDKRLNMSKCIKVCKDSTQTMCCRNNSFITGVLEVNPRMSSAHCNLHKAALASKTLPD
ncbi:Zinc finger BED domain-containing protein 5 [Trichinella pseudospiralis]|uniref:Zinc finger BED domain-containing protein 5 n=1 Tax=Trichinella pseudospiralis TaxID=6337 RepID=A0A0V1EAD2_TRIPS|nr:Zinc finger BED domain-containing protein 5 [Trichinella pseudospiralis]